MREKLLTALADRLRAVERLVDKIDRSVERIELVTVVREPSTSLSADAYNGLRKQVIAAVGERNAHLHQLVKFDSALRAGATSAELATLVREWLGQASVELVDDPSAEGAFDFVGPAGGAALRVIRPAYVDAVTRRTVQMGVVERLDRAESPPDEDQPNDGSDGAAVAAKDPATVAAAVAAESLEEDEPSAGGPTGVSGGDE
jgi:hypothetical protein